MKLTIHRKMVIGFAVVICIMIGAHAYMLSQLHSLSQAAQAALTFEVQAIDIAKRMQTLLYDEDSHARKYLVTRDQAYYDLFLETSREFQKLLASLVQTEAARRDLLHQVAQRHHWLSRSLPEAANSGRGSSASPNAIDNVARKENIDIIDRSLKGLIRLNQISIDDSMAAFVEATHRSSLVAAALTLLTILAASITAWMIARTITRPITKVIQATQQIARGSFEPIGVPSHDETALLAAAINDMGEQLKAINEAKADLMHRIVHELRNPLQVIFSARDLLAEGEMGSLNAKQLEMLDLIGSNTEKLMSFTNQFLDLAKVEAGMMQYHRKPTDLATLAARAVADTRTLAARKEISVTLSATPVPPLLADADKLSQVFSNLLSNAIKYTERGGTVEVAISCSDLETRVAVRDSGIGIAAEELPKLFTKFYQASNASKILVQGTGIGLALVKAFVEGHGGRVSVESKLGVGSTFTVEFPLADAGQLNRPGDKRAA